MPPDFREHSAHTAGLSLMSTQTEGRGLGPAAHLQLPASSGLCGVTMAQGVSHRCFSDGKHEFQGNAALPCRWAGLPETRPGPA